MCAWYRPKYQYSILDKYLASWICIPSYIRLWKCTWEIMGYTSDTENSLKFQTSSWEYISNDMRCFILFSKNKDTLIDVVLNNYNTDYCPIICNDDGNNHTNQKIILIKSSLIWSFGWSQSTCYQFENFIKSNGGWLLAF